MNTNTDSGVPAGPSPAQGPRIHRAGRDRFKGLKRILVVDDNKIVLKTTARKLKAAGYEVLMAEDGGSAIRMVRQLLPHLILLDLDFPPDVGHGGGVPWDGLLILSWLRRTIGVQKTPVIVITGGNLEKYKDRLMESGVLDIFLKPIDHEALLVAIRWALNEEGPSGQPAAELSALIEPAARQKVLFVDDTNDWRYLGAVFLGEHGYEVATAEDPISALMQVSEFKPNLVVLDLNLGGQSALALLKVLSELHSEVPVLLYTGMDLHSEEVSELIKRGAWDCLRKGSLEELVAAVERIISGPDAAIPKSEAEVSLAAARSASDARAENTEAAPECGRALPSLDGLRTGTTEELLSAVQRARSMTPEEILGVPEPAIVISDEVIESAAESILIVEDDAALAETLRSFLESQSFRVSVVTGGAEAVSLIEAVDVDLVLFDLTMPGFSAPQFYDAVKAVKPHLCPRIIFMSSDDSHPADDGFVRRLNGISVWKPFQMDWVLEAIQTIRAGTHQARLAAR